MRATTNVAAAAGAGALLVTAAVVSGVLSGGSSDSTTTAPPTTADAARLLTQATFGPTDADIAAVQSAGISGWVTQQEAMPYTYSTLAYMNKRQAANPPSIGADNFFQESFWTRAATGQDQLRQRVQFALSQIFVISLQNGEINAQGAGSYYDMLGANAFGNFRTLLEKVTLHPMMGVYLTSLANVKENPATGQHPDQNYAREVMQLMTIGLVQLNQDGTPKLDSHGNTIPTYGPSDVEGLAQVFTGYSWYSPSPNSTSFFFPYPPDLFQKNLASVTPMIAYPQYHSISQKTFLGKTIPAVSAASTTEMSSDLKTALDALFNHPNVGPFIGKQLIQRLVTSNPSPAYVHRVALTFDDDGNGVRGNMGAVVKAILTDPEARDPTLAAGPNYGKLREPVLRITNWMRAFKATSKSGVYEISRSGDPLQAEESLLYANSVFNFWRPGYVPPNTRLSAQNLTAPEFQVVNELSTINYVNGMVALVDYGIGFNNITWSGTDVTSNYATEVSLANNPTALVARMNELLFCGSMSTTLQNQIIAAVNAVPVPKATSTNSAAVNAALLIRAKTAVYLSLTSGEYLAQR
jgi:uncharacterized protein (DUF1800 family)